MVVEENKKLKMAIEKEMEDHQVTKKTLIVVTGERDEQKEFMEKLRQLRRAGRELLDIQPPKATKIPLASK